MSLIARRTKVLKFRQLIIDTISSAYPNKISIAVIIASARIPIIKEVESNEIIGLLDELVAEGVLIGHENQRYSFNAFHASSLENNMNSEKFFTLPEKELRQIKATESHHDKKLRLLQRRVHTFLQREIQFEQDIVLLKEILPQTFVFDDVRNIIPIPWKMDMRRSNKVYLLQCLIHLIDICFLIQDSHLIHYQRAM